MAGFTTGDPPLPTAIGAASVDAAIGVIMVLALWGCDRTRYEITPTDLQVRCGPFRTTVPLAAIVEVFPTRNPVGAAAPSLDRLQIDYRHKHGGMAFALISPKDKEGFVRDLASTAPQLRRVGDEPLRLKAEALPDPW